MKMRIFVSLLFLSVFSGCASYFDQKINQEKSEDLTKNFEIPKDTLEKFQIIEEIKISPPPATEEDRKNKKALIPQKIKKIKEVTKEIVKENLKESPLPLDYPQELLQLDQKSKKFWSHFKNRSFPKENIVIEVSFLGLHVGNLAVTNLAKTKIANADAYHLKARFITEKFYEKFYKIDDTLESFVSSVDFRSFRYSLTQRESGQEVDDLQFFDYEKLKTFHWFRRLKKGEDKKSELEAYIPKYIQDSFSVIYFVRGLPLQKGDIYEIPVVNKAKIWISKIVVLGEDEVKFNNKWVKAIKLKAENTLIENKDKKTSVDFWYSDDLERKLLKFSAKIKIGAVEGRLIFFTPGKEE